MSTYSTNYFLIALTAACLMANGCTSESKVSLKNQTDIASDSADPVRRSGNSYRAALTKKALRGLDYSSGRVVVDNEFAAAVTDGLNIEDCQTQFEIGKQALTDGRLFASIESLTRAIILDPSRVEFYEQLGAALITKRKTALAEAALRSALDLDENSAFAHEKLALVLSASASRFDEAIEHYKTTVDLDPENGHAYSRLAILNYYQGRSRESRKNVKLAVASGYRVPPQFLRLLNGNQPPAANLNGGGIPDIGAQMRVDLNNAAPANETTAASSDIDPDFAIAGWNDYRNPGFIRSGFSMSFDGGGSWQDFLLRPPAANQNSVEGDPMTCFDNRTGNIWAGAISFGANGGVYVARKNAGDTSFQPTVMAAVSGFADKGWMAAGVDPFDKNATRVYIGYNQGLLASTDDGDTWLGPQTFPAAGLGWLPRIGPDGELYLTYWDLNNTDQYKMIRSLNGGATFEGPFTIATRMDSWFIDGTRFPGRFRVAPLVTSAVDPTDGTLYAVYADTTDIAGGNSNVDIYCCHSVDQGTTWSTPTIVNTDAKVPGDQFFPWIEVDDCGRLHLLFYDTRSVVQNDNTNDGPGQPPALIEAYYAYSDDGGNSWSEIVLTPNAFSSADTGIPTEFIGDYLGMGVAGSTVYPCYMSTQDGISNIYVHAITNPFLLGDVNQDGVVNLLDIQPFVDLIANQEFDKAADINGDGAVNLLDVSPFVALIQQGS